LPVIGIKKNRSEELFAFDLKYWRQGVRFLCGIDEAGRGPLAGPVVAAAVVFSPHSKMTLIDDSKRLSAKLRETLAEQIKKEAVAFAVASASVEEIQQFNILKATFLAMQRAVQQLKVIPDFILVDGRDFPLFLSSDQSKSIRGRAVTGGDRLSQTVAAASILAKVHRDGLMIKYAEQYPRYGFDRHKGYGTKEHREKILEFGPCPIHRKLFIRKILERQQTLDF